MLYNPAEDSYLLKKCVEKYSKGKTVLDIGSGTGIQAIASLNSGAKSVLCSDISLELISFLKKQGLNAIKSNLFSNIKGKFDLIIFNPPYLPEDKREDMESRRATTGGKEGDEITLKFRKQSVKHLEKNGIIFLLVSSLTPKKRILELLRELSLKKKLLSKEELFFESLEVWKIY